MKQLNKAEKTFQELIEGDNIYYIDPKKPEEIQFLPVKGTRPFEPKKGHIYVDYYQSSSALELVKDPTLIPVRSILVKATDTRVMSMSMPPTVYFTNKRALESFMGIHLKK